MEQGPYLLDTESREQEDPGPKPGVSIYVLYKGQVISIEGNK